MARTTKSDQARSFLCAANVLRERADAIASNPTLEPPEAEDPPHLRLMPVFFLYGYALENLVNPRGKMREALRSCKFKTYDR